ncbi:MAG: glycerophosphodiester phosphodiesterase [Firmicutes bacterium]|nr:glycerophosphodiester phosphodiesterase [Bacillota bacterium]
MNKSQKLLRNKILWFLMLLGAFIYLNNSSWLVKPAGKPLLLAHRGLAQTYPMEGITADTNTAARIYPPEHPYLENTIASMEAAFQAGADMVELDIQPTTDGQFAVFHDWILDYRTNGKGIMREHSMAELKALDIGYGYTADQGKTYPFRGKGIGLMPTLDEVLNYFPPTRSFLIHIKSNDPKEGELLAGYLKDLPKDRLANLAVYGGDKPIETLKQRLPGLKVMSRATVMRAFIPYLLAGWTGYIPAGMKNAFFYLPLRYARFLWGWPHRFVKRVKDADSVFVVVAGEGPWSEGFDTVEDLQQIPPGYTGGIWTGRIDRIGPLFKNREGNK